MTILIIQVNDNDDNEDDRDEDQRMKVMGAMTDEGLDSACASVRMHPVSVQCSAPSASVQPVRKSICTHCSTFLMPMMYLSTGTMYMCTCVHVHLECNVQCTRVQGTLYLSTSRSQQHRNQSGNRGAPSCNPLNNLHFLLPTSTTLGMVSALYFSCQYISTWGWLDPHLSIRHFLSPVSVI